MGQRVFQVQEEEVRNIHDLFINPFISLSTHTCIHMYIHTYVVMVISLLLVFGISKWFSYSLKCLNY